MEKQIEFFEKFCFKTSEILEYSKKSRKLSSCAKFCQSIQLPQSIKIWNFLKLSVILRKTIEIPWTLKSMHRLLKNFTKFQEKWNITQQWKKHRNTKEYHKKCIFSEKVWKNRLIDSQTFEVFRKFCKDFQKYCTKSFELLYLKRTAKNSPPRYKK